MIKSQSYFNASEKTAPTMEHLPTKEVICHSSLDNKNPRLRGFLEPSDGLEPSTPSLPCSIHRKWMQAMAEDSK